MATATYIPLATVTLAATATSVTFSSISSAYTDLILVSSTKITSNNGLQIRFNGDTTTSNYAFIGMYGDGSDVYSSSGQANAIAKSSAAFGNSIIHVNGYASGHYKTAISRSNPSGYMTWGNTLYWNSTSAITSIQLYGDTFQIGSQFTLYGVGA